MTITLTDIGKRYNNQWIFNGVNATLSTGDKVVFVGDNGSGKSTLLKICSGFLSADKGTIVFEQKGSTLKIEDVHKEVAMAAPYIELIEEMTLMEFFNFHFSFKSSLVPISKMIQQIELVGNEHKLISTFSSGMKQRVSLAQAIFSNTAILLLDEPCSNFDEKGFALYNSLIEKYSNDRLIIIASNDEREYAACNKRIEVQMF